MAERTMNRNRWQAVLCWGAFLATAPTAWAQIPSGDPHIGYIYPAGGQRGEEFEVTVGDPVGSQYLAVGSVLSSVPSAK